MMGLGAAFAFATSPITILATLAAVTAANWDKLKNSFGGSDSIFSAVANAIANTASRLFDLNKAFKGALELYALGKSLLSGNGWTASLDAARQAGADFDSAAKQSGQTFAQSWFDGAKGTLDSAAKWLEGRFAGVTSDYNRLMTDSTPHEFQGAGNYAANRELYAHKDNSLSEELKREWERINPLNKALLDYKIALESLAKMRGKIDPLGHVIGDADIAKLRDAARETALRDAFPAAAKISELMDRVKMEREALANVGGNTSKEALDQEKQFLTIKYELLKKHVQLRTDEEQALRGLIAAEHQLAKGGDSDPFTRWANAQKSAQDSLNDSISSGMDTLADGLAKAVTSGKDLRSTLQGVLKEISATFIRAGIRSLMSDGLKQMNLGSLFGTGMNGSIAKALGLGQGVLDRANSSLDDAAKAIGQTATAQMNVEAGVVYLNGATIGGASGLDAFKPGADISRAVNPSAVGGISPSNDNGGVALFGSTALQEFKSNIRTGGLGSIPANSAQLFGAGINPGQALGALPGFKDALKTSADGITRNSIAAFGQGLQRQIAPVAERIGVTQPTFQKVTDRSLESLYKNANLDKVTEANLRGIHPDLQRTFLRAKEISGQNFTMNHGQGLRSQAEANANAARGLGIRNSQHLEGTAGDVNLYRNGRYIANGQDPAYSQFNNAMQQAAREQGVPIKWGGDFKDYDHWQLPRGWKGSHKQAGIDPTPTGSINATQKLADQSKRAQQALEAQTAATKKIEETTKQASTVTQQMSQPLQSFDGGLSKLSQNLTAGVPATESFTSEIEKMIQKLASGLGGGGEGGLLGGAGELLGGLFSEGGYVGSPVSSAAMPASFWAGAPHYSEGTPNTSGGMPAILHDNEAVIPLSRGRSIPVELKGAGEAGGTVNNYHVSTNVQGVNDFHSFRRSHGQIVAAMQREVGRIGARNN